MYEHYVLQIWDKLIQSQKFFLRRLKILLNLLLGASWKKNHISKVKPNNMLIDIKKSCLPLQLIQLTYHECYSGLMATNVKVCNIPCLPPQAMLTCWWCTMTPVTSSTATARTLASGRCWPPSPRGLVTSTRPSRVSHQTLSGGIIRTLSAGQQSKVYLVGGRSKDGRSLRSVFCYDLATATWSRLADMKRCVT